MMHRLLLLVFLFLNTLPLALSEYADNSSFIIKDPHKFQTKEEYRAVVAGIRTDLEALKPRRLINFCIAIDFGKSEDALNLMVCYYTQQYKLLISGFEYIDSDNSKFEYMKEAIVKNLHQEQAACEDARTCESKNECIRAFYDGLLGSAMIIERILNGVTFNQLYKESASLI